MRFRRLIIVIIVTIITKNSRVNPTKKQMKPKFLSMMHCLLKYQSINLQHELGCSGPALTLQYILKILNINKMHC